MMKFFFLTLAIFSTAFFFLSLGVLLTGKRLQGSCGGKALCLFCKKRGQCDEEKEKDKVL